MFQVLPCNQTLVQSFCPTAVFCATRGSGGDKSPKTPSRFLCCFVLLERRKTLLSNNLTALFVLSGPCLSWRASCLVSLSLSLSPSLLLCFSLSVTNTWTPAGRYLAHLASAAAQQDESLRAGVQVPSCIRRVSQGVYGCCVRRWCCAYRGGTRARQHKGVRESNRVCAYY